MDIWQVYVGIIVEFLFELYVFYFLLAGKLKRRRNFWWRLVGSMALVLLVSYGVAYLYTIFGDTVVGRTALYVLLFALTLLQGFFLFDEPFWTVLFCASAAYAIQNLVYKIYLTQYLFGKLTGIYAFGGGFIYHVLFRIMYYGVFTLLACLAWVVLIRKMQEKIALEQLNYRIFIIVLVILGVSVLLCSTEDIFFERLGMGVETVNLQFNELFILRQAGNTLAIVSCVVILILMYKTLEQKDMQREIEQLQLAIRQSEQQYHISEETIHMINMKCHDMKYKLDAALKGSGVSLDDFNDLRSSIAIYDSNIETGNKLLNVLFTEKSLYCEQNGIRLSCMIDGKRLSFMQDGDLYCLFGNLADNALEAVIRIQDRKKRVISVSVKAKDGMVLVQEENYFTGELVCNENGLPTTTKKDKNYHGFGMSSMRMIAHKYGGEMIVGTEGDVFRLTLLFPDCNGTQKGEIK